MARFGTPTSSKNEHYGIATAPIRAYPGSQASDGVSISPGIGRVAIDAVESAASPRASVPKPPIPINVSLRYRPNAPAMVTGLREGD